MNRVEALEWLASLAEDFPSLEVEEGINEAIAALSSPCACGGEKPLAEVDGWMNECDVDGIRSSIDPLPWVSCAALLGESDPDNGFIVPVRHIILEKPCS